MDVTNLYQNVELSDELYSAFSEIEELIQGIDEQVAGLEFFEVPPGLQQRFTSHLAKLKAASREILENSKASLVKYESRLNNE